MNRRRRAKPGAFGPFQKGKKAKASWLFYKPAKPGAFGPFQKGKKAGASWPFHEPAKPGEGGSLLAFP
jgi:hypothetical protein